MNGCKSSIYIRLSAYFRDQIPVKKDRMTEKTIYYSNEEITVAWKPALCIHSGNCVRGLGKVFDPGRKSWIDMSQADSAQIVAQVKKCPSGALSISEKKPA